jgi:hypothetical protein
MIVIGDWGYSNQKPIMIMDRGLGLSMCTSDIWADRESCEVGRAEGLG